MGDPFMRNHYKYDNDLYNNDNNDDNYTKIQSDYQTYSLNILFVSLIFFSFGYNIAKICKINCSTLFHKCILKKKLKESLLQDNLNEECSICLDYLSKDNKIIKLECDHIYHSECIKEWLLRDKDNNCPLCRNNI